MLESTADRIDPDKPKAPEFPPFLEWLQKVSPTWVWTWAYLIFIQIQLQRITDREIDRLMLFIPPRHGKSEQCTVRYPIWRICRKPETRVIVGAYSADLAFKFSRKMRRIAKAEKVRLAPDQQAVNDWATEEGGGVRVAGVGGGVTGMGADLIIIDDPVKSRAEANSPAYRDKCYDWYTDDLLTRLEPGGAIILIMTRWHDDDLAGRILASAEGPDWTVIKLPALAEENDPLGRAPGAALCPERYDVDELLRRKKVLKSSFEALFQQNPQPAGGSIFRAEWFADRYQKLPRLLEIWSCWDTALKDKEQNDESACATFASGADGNVYLLSILHGRWETPDLAKYLVDRARWHREQFGERYRGDYVEDKVSGTTLMQYVRRTDPDLVLIPVSTNNQSKEERAHGVTPLCESLRVRLPDSTIYPFTAGGIADLVGQLMRFPLSKHDDLVDVFVYGLLRFLGKIGVKKSRRGKARAAGT